MTLTSPPTASHSCAPCSRVMSTLSWSPASAMTLPEMGPQLGDPELHEVAQQPAEMAVVAAARRRRRRCRGLVVVVLQHAVLVRQAEDLDPGGGAEAASASASSPEGFAASPIFWNLPAATRTEAPRGRDRDAIEAPRARVETRADDAVGAAGAASDDARDIAWDVVEHGAASRFGGAAWRRLTVECRARVT